MVLFVKKPSELHKPPTLLLVDENAIVEAENTETTRSNGFGRIVKLPPRQNVSKARQKLPNLAASAI